MKTTAKSCGWKLTERSYTVNQKFDATAASELTMEKEGKPVIVVRGIWGYELKIGCGKMYWISDSQAPVDRILRRFGAPDLETAWTALDDEKERREMEREMRDWTEDDWMAAESERLMNLRNEW